MNIFQRDARFCPYQKTANNGKYVDSSFDKIAKTFIKFDKNITITGRRDPCDPTHFILIQTNIYQSGTKEVITRRLSECQVNALFYKMDNCL